MKEKQVSERKSRSGRSIASSIRDSSGFTVRDCKQDVVNACRRLQLFFKCIFTHLIKNTLFDYDNSIL
jgi:hypothetical protein